MDSAEDRPGAALAPYDLPDCTALAFVKLALVLEPGCGCTEDPERLPAVDLAAMVEFVAQDLA